MLQPEPVRTAVTDVLDIVKGAQRCAMEQNDCCLQLALAPWVQEQSKRLSGVVSLGLGPCRGKRIADNRGCQYQQDVLFH